MLVLSELVRNCLSSVKMASSDSASLARRKVAREARSRPWLSGSKLTLKGLSSPPEAAARVSSAKEAVKTVRKVSTCAYMAQGLGSGGETTLTRTSQSTEQSLNEVTGAAKPSDISEGLVTLMKSEADAESLVRSPDVKLARSCKTEDPAVSETPSAESTVTRRSALPILRRSVAPSQVSLAGRPVVRAVGALGSRIPVAKTVVRLTTAGKVFGKTASEVFGAKKPEKEKVDKTGCVRGVSAKAVSLSTKVERLGLKSQRPSKPAPKVLRLTPLPVGSPEKRVSFTLMPVVGFQKHYYSAAKLNHGERRCCSGVAERETGPCPRCVFGWPDVPDFQTWFEAQQSARVSKG